MVVECNAHAFFATEHLTGHECVEDSCAGQWEAEIEAEQPPIFDILVELEKDPIVKWATTNEYIDLIGLKWGLSLHHTECFALCTVLLKFLTNMIYPVGTYTAQRFKVGTDVMCVFCNSSPETFDHSFWKRCNVSDLCTNYRITWTKTTKGLLFCNTDSEYSFFHYHIILVFCFHKKNLSKMIFFVQRMIN